jgi:hypothetical protein
MQPYFFPYLGYFDIINCVDKWIVFDTAQYIRHGWINRNRILHPNKGWQYIIVPLEKHPREASIAEVQIAEDSKWVQRIVGQIQHYKRRAPNFNETVALIEDCLNPRERSISRLNVSILEEVCAVLKIDFDYSFFSEMNLRLGPVDGPGDWALRICEAMGAREYVNLPGGIEIFDKRRFDQSDIRLNIRNVPALEYSCRRYEFIPNLSIVDVLMWNDPQRIKFYLDEMR